MGIDVIVPVYGGRRYERYARERAFPSVELQTLRPDNVIICAGRNPSDARNNGAAHGSAEWLCFLDADDMLDPGYLEAMMTGTADVRGPATTFVQPDGSETAPALVVARDLEDSNYLVIGTLIRRELFERLGGFKPWPVHEDYCLWLRCQRAGASIEQIPAAIYRVFERPGSRNRRPLSFKRRIDERIRASA